MQPVSISKKLARHYKNTRTVMGIGILVFGVCMIISTVFLYPQMFLKPIFDSRMLMRNISTSHVSIVFFSP